VRSYRCMLHLLNFLWIFRPIKAHCHGKAPYYFFHLNHRCYTATKMANKNLYYAVISLLAMFSIIPGIQGGFFNPNPSLGDKPVSNFCTPFLIHLIPFLIWWFLLYSQILFVFIYTVWVRFKYIFHSCIFIIYMYFRLMLELSWIGWIK